MKKLIYLIAFILIGSSVFAQTWPASPWNTVTGKNNGKDSIANQRLKNNPTEDSVLSTDIYGRFKNKRMFGDSANITNIYNTFDSITIINNYLSGVDSTTTKLLSGSEINDSNFTFHNTALTYLILGVKYTALEQTLVLSASDSTYDRYVTVVVDQSGYVYAIYGVASSSADIPQIPIDVCPIVTYFIPHLSTTPQGIQNITVYKENIEWVLSGNVTGLDGNYLVNPYAGLKSTYIPALINGQYFNYTDGSTHTASDFAYLSFYIRLGAAFKNTNHLSVSFQNSGSASSTLLTIANGSFGFNSSLINQYQLVAIPFSALSFVNQSFNQVHFIVSGTLSTGFQVDNVILQASNGITTGGSVVTSFNNRNGAVLPQRIDYRWYHDSMSISSDGKKIINWNNGIALGDSTQYTNGPDTTMYNVHGLQVIPKIVSGSAYDSVQLLLAAGTGMTIVDSAITVNGITLYYKVFRSTGGGGGGITTAQLTDSLNARALLYGTVTSVAAITLGTTGTDLSSTVANSTTTPVITLNVPTASASNRGALSSTDWTTFNNKEPAITAPNTALKYWTGYKIYGSLYDSVRAAFSITTTGTSGAATYNSSTGVFNIPQYAGTTYSAGTGLTLTTTTFSVNTSQNISILSNLTSNGLIKTSGGTGALSIATAGTDYQAPITLTTTGTSGAATLISNTLNIPQYSGGSSGLTVQRVTSGSSGTVTGSNYIYVIDPASTLASYTATLPASPTDGQVVMFVFGGTLTSGLIVTALTISPNTSQAIIDNTPPSSATSDDGLKYYWVSANSKWYRFKP